MAQLIARLLRDYLLRDAGHYPVVTLTGPWQSGKTTLARTAFPDHASVQLEETDMRTFSREDPHWSCRPRRTSGS
jgi:predicted AAA+ superfamily ATPase